MHPKKTLLFIDLFAGLGGIRLGLECACKQLNLNSQCVFTSEIKKDAVRTYQKNFPNSEVSGDIRKISSEEIPDFDILLAGFPCQAFSRAGTRQGFSDTRGTLFFEVERILRDKQPANFILENVEGLVTNDRGKTLRTILCKLKDLGYKVTWEVLNALDFGVPQDRKRIYIVGTRSHPIFLDTLPKSKPIFLSHILETGKPTLKTEFIVDGDGLRKLTIREGLRLFGFPESYQIDLSQKKAFDLLGNTVVVSVIEKIAHRLYS